MGDDAFSRALVQARPVFLGGFPSAGAFACWSRGLPIQTHRGRQGEGKRAGT